MTTQAMTTAIVPTPVMTMIIKRLSDFTVKRLSGINNIPHLCVKVRHGDGYCWFGINVLHVTDTRPWTAETARQVEKEFTEAMHKIVDLKEMMTEVPRLMDSLQDITTGRRRPIMFGTGSNEKIQITATNNIQIEVYREAVKDESLTYGGYLFELTTYDHLGHSTDHALFVYHRGVILYNNASADEIAEFAITELRNAFPELEYANEMEIHFVYQVDRQRNRREVK
ncbi:hypothetical protein PHABIO_423 [Pseudomonas phage Phabio]|uniref:Uncharacterized protein n=1 Tax=Pseudomonas phage Phabio TaxID=2006668 RepID=A0A1Y0SWT8_9CAUD|nr:hypothetical protein MZD05_gp423 [Pseudomonas phage Phabio]ARV77054.1 hypothetical protein PHABIO_423 [Pseudomonas phage Phabio]